MAEKANVPKSIRMEDFKVKFYLPHDDKTLVAMLTRHGHRVVYNRSEYFDIALFTGGADVHPFMYGEKVHPTTTFDLRRDMSDNVAFRNMTAITPKVGICRGAQFLNVMSGGSLYQHIDKHAIAGTHMACNVHDPNDAFPVSSTHHQMMRPGPEAYVLLTADESSYRYTGADKFTAPHFPEDDTEACYYMNTNSFCVQFHPEYMAPDSPAVNWFFDNLHTFFNGDVAKRRWAFGQPGV